MLALGESAAIHGMDLWGQPGLQVYLLLLQHLCIFIVMYSQLEPVRWQGGFISGHQIQTGHVENM